jgi:hypothetical protein
VNPAPPGYLAYGPLVPAVPGWGGASGVSEGVHEGVQEAGEAMTIGDWLIMALIFTHMGSHADDYGRSRDARLYCALAIGAYAMAVLRIAA